MSESSKRVNAFFKKALRADVDLIRSKIILSERQEKIFDMFYLRKNDINFIADSLFISSEVVKKELKSIRLRLIPLL